MALTNSAMGQVPRLDQASRIDSGIPAIATEEIYVPVAAAGEKAE
jgi:hypothetical protein